MISSSVAALSVKVSTLPVDAASYILVNWQVDVSFDMRRVRFGAVKQTLLAALQAVGK
jgi:hypothetical protein